MNCGCAPAYELIGTTEFAAICGVSKQAVYNWQVRLANFPEPIHRLSNGPVWFRWQARLWNRERKRREPVVKLTPQQFEAALYLLSPGYLPLLRRAIYARVGTTTMNLEKHTKALALLEEIEEDKQWAK